MSGTYVDDRPMRVLYVLDVPSQHWSQAVKRWKLPSYWKMTLASIAVVPPERAARESYEVEAGFPVLESSLGFTRKL